MDFVQLMAELDLLPAGNRLGFIQQMDNEFSTLMNANKNLNCFKQLLLKLPRDDRSAVVVHLGFDFIDDCIEHANELASLLSDFPSDEAADLLSDMYFVDEPDGLLSFKRVLKDFMGLSDVLQALGEEQQIRWILEMVPGFIHNSNELSIILGLLGHEEVCAYFLNEFQGNLPRVMEHASFEDVLDILEKVPAAKRLEVLGYMGESIFSQYEPQVSAQLHPQNEADANHQPENAVAPSSFIIWLLDENQEPLPNDSYEL